jgi:DNA-directed RNA polymerase subunit K/omega
MAMEIEESLELSRQALVVVKSRYLLSILVAQRIHQLERGIQPTIEIDPADVIPSAYFEIALREIIKGSMDIEQVEEVS